MEINSLSKRYHVRNLDKSDVDMIYDLMCRNHIFYQYHPPFVTKESILDDMAALPPNKNADDKIYAGFFCNESLVAILDLILDYPIKGIAFIGFFMTDIRYQHKGIGSQIVCDMIDCLKSSGYTEIRLGVDKGNPQSHAFWVKNNFTAIGEDQYVLMSRKI